MEDLTTSSNSGRDFQLGIKYFWLACFQSALYHYPPYPSLQNGGLKEESWVDRSDDCTPSAMLRDHTANTIFFMSETYRASHTHARWYPLFMNGVDCGIAIFLILNDSL